MLHTTNPTKRRKILQKECTIRLHGNTAFTAIFSDFDEGNYPPDANVFIEAHRGNTFEKFNCGTVNNITTPKNQEFSSVDTEQGAPLFSLFVVDNGKILASAELMLEDEKKKQGLLPRKPYPLGEELWRVDFNMGRDGQPYLLVNDNADQAFLDQFDKSEIYLSLVMPHALREILMHYLLSGDEIDEEDEWKVKWLEVAKKYNPNAELPDPDDDRELIQQYIDEVIRLFSDQFKFNQTVTDRMESTRRKKREHGYV